MAASKYNRRFNVRRQSAAQKTHLKKLQVGRSGRREPKAASSTSRRKVPVLVPLTPKTRRIASLERDKSTLKSNLHNIRRRLSRSAKTSDSLNAALRSQNPSTTTPLYRALALVKPPSATSYVPPPTPVSESQTPSGGPTALFPAPAAPDRAVLPRSGPSRHQDADPLKKLRAQVGKLRKEKDALRKQVSRSTTGRGKEIEKAISTAQSNAAIRFYIKNKGVVTEETRSLVRSLVQLHIPFDNVLEVICRVLRAAGIEVIGKFTRHSVRRFVGEGGVWSRLQTGHEIKQAESMTGASDGTTTKGVNIEASNLTIPTPSYNPQYDPSGGPQHSVRALPTEVATGHTSEEQGGGWVGRGTDILETYNESPLGCDAPSRGVKVPVGLSKGRRADLVQALVEVLRGLDEDKVTLLYAQNVAERERAALLPRTDGIPSETIGETAVGEEQSESEDEDD
ncbi:hypothetical protein EUX98_g1554 [Antrodiella citrinella]|uniref:Uncharacterized protein n=1 Tax=Antrodiella citrinella TaxID=2447956 RepID=A0A4S4N143_9APHY|nr:hypothetical protein EUX98_g1554 [Antrodiella citrinella]